MSEIYRIYVIGEVKSVYYSRSIKKPLAAEMTEAI